MKKVQLLVLCGWIPVSISAKKTPAPVTKKPGRHSSYRPDPYQIRNRTGPPIFSNANRLIEHPAKNFQNTQGPP